MVRNDQQRVRSLLAEAITILCKNCLAYKSEFQVEGLLGITLDQDEVFLVNINENINDTGGTGITNVQLPGMMPPDQLLGINQQHEMQSSRSNRVYPVSRPIQSKSPFFPRRTGMYGNNRGRGRGRGRGKYPIRPPSRQARTSMDSIEPLAKQPHLNIPTDNDQATTTHNDPIEIKEDENGQEQQDHGNQNEEMDQEDMKKDTSTTETDQEQGNKTGTDALVALDFGDMLQQYEEAAPNLQDNRQSDEHHGQQTNDQDQEHQQTTEQDQQEPMQVVIKPDPDQADMNSLTSPNTNSHTDNVFSSPMEPGTAIFATPHTGPLFPGGPPGGGQFMDPSLAGFSAWGQPSVPSSQGLQGYSPVRSKPSTPRKSGPGRPSAAAGSPGQAGSGQVGSGTVTQKYHCSLCNMVIGNMHHMRRHMDTVHTKAVLYHCPVCQKAFSRKDNLRRHLRMVHQGGKDSDEYALQGLMDDFKEK